MMACAGCTSAATHGASSPRRYLVVVVSWQRPTTYTQRYDTLHPVDQFELRHIIDVLPGIDCSTWVYPCAHDLRPRMAFAICHDVIMMTPGQLTRCCNTDQVPLSILDAKNDGESLSFDLRSFMIIRCS